MTMDNGAFQPINNRDEITASLDGTPVPLPPHHRSLNHIRCQLETLALEQQRVLCSLSVDGQAINLTQPLPQLKTFASIEAVSVALDESVLLLLKAAWQQTHQLRDCVQSSLTLVLINDAPVARELWWNLARRLKDPILTLSLLPDHLCGPANGRASFKQLRKWQLEQIAVIIREVDRSCDAPDTIPLSNSLENRVLPWLDKLSELIELWHETAMAASRLGIKHDTY